MVSFPIVPCDAELDPFRCDACRQCPLEQTVLIVMRRNRQEVESGEILKGGEVGRVVQILKEAHPRQRKS